jgi:hypothetical protein
MDRVELDLFMTLTACWKSNHPLALEDKNRGGGNSRGVDAHSSSIRPNVNDRQNLIEPRM